MKVTIETISSSGACKEGWAEEFAALYPHGFEGEWTLEEQLRVIRSPLRQWFGWAVERGIVPMWSMENLDLAEANLAWADLRRANLAGANLAWADLAGANLMGAE